MYPGAEAALLLISLTSSMKMSLTGHTILVTFSLESLLMLSSGMIAEIGGQPNFCSLVGFFCAWILERLLTPASFVSVTFV